MAAKMVELGKRRGNEGWYIFTVDETNLAKLQAGDEVVPAYEAIDLLQEVLCVESGGK